MAVGGTGVKRGRKCDQVLAGARDVFLSDGFEGASVDDIARAANVSKATLYNYFPDKRLLFMEVARTECNRQAEIALEQIDLQAPAAVVLRSVAQQIVGFITSDFSQRIYRICVGESDRFPELGRGFYESGPMLVRARLLEYLHQAEERGEVVITDFELAADQFAELCKTHIFARLVFNMQSQFSQAEKDRVIDGAVEMFMARYGVTETR